MALIGVYLSFDRKSRSLKEKIFQGSLAFSLIVDVSKIS